MWLSTIPWVAAPNFIVNDNYTQILIEVPAGATTGPIKLVVGYDTVTTAEDFVIGCETPLTASYSKQHQCNQFPLHRPPEEQNHIHSRWITSNSVATMCSPDFSYGQTYTVYVEDDRGLPW